MAIKPDDRVALVGRTGSGKTYLARLLLANVRRLVVVDSKSSLAEWSLEIPSSRDWRSFERGNPARWRVLHPITDDPQSWYEQLFQRLYLIGNVTVYIDEAYAVTPVGKQPGAWLSALYTRGRERGISVWAATQRPTWIPLFMLSESDWFFIFRLQMAEDRRRMAQIVGNEVLRPIPDKHGMYTYHVDQDTPVYRPYAVEKGPDM